MDNIILYWRTHSTGWNYGGTYATKALALKNAKRQLRGVFDYRIEVNGKLIEQGTTRANELNAQGG